MSGQQWDGFPTRVLGARGTWAPSAVSSWSVLKTDATRGLRRVLLICIGEPPSVRRPGSPSRVTG
jgi:hypothetical protein